MAGTTVRDDGVVEAAFTVAARGADIDVDLAMAYVRETMGQSKIAVFNALLGDAVRAEAANAAFERAFAALVRDGAVGALGGAEALFEELRSRGVAICLTTGFAPATRDAIIDHLGWGPLIDLAVSPIDAGRGRPWPDMILHAVLRLGAEAVADVAVAGDTTSDLVAGTRAGAGIVAGVLTGAHSAEQLATAPHTHLLGSIADLGAVIGSR
jgi:phosphonatase-like hydrolase